MPNQQRLLRIWQDNDVIEKVTAITGAAEMYRAIGYLAQWGLSMADDVTLNVFYADDVQPEIVATYRKSSAPDKIEYQIGAVWNADSKQFGFHS